MDPVSLLVARADDAPSGENLEYDPEFVEMELAAQPGEESQFGDTVKEAEGADYGEVAEKALAILERSHDLRAAIFLGEAMLATSGLTDFADVTAYVRGCLEQYWDSCHPQLDEDDDDDPTMRINAVQNLCGQPGGQSGPSPVYRALRNAPLSESRGFGRFSFRDVEISEGRAQPRAGEDAPANSANIAAAFQDSDPEVLQRRLTAVKAIRDDLKAISAVFDDKTPGQGPELDPLIKLAHDIHTTLKRFAGGDEPAEAEAASDDGAAPEGEAAPESGAAAPRAVGGIASRSDVTNALDRVIDYYQRNEPSSPVPILLKRAKRLVNADFMTIMKDMAPGGVENVHLIGGIDDE